MTPRWSFEVMRGHHHLCGHNSKQNEDSELKPTSMCLSHRDASFHMHHDLLRSPLDLDQRSNFKVDLLRSASIPVDVPRREKHNDVSSITLS